MGKVPSNVKQFHALADAIAFISAPVPRGRKCWAEKVKRIVPN